MCKQHLEEVQFWKPQNSRFLEQVCCSCGGSGNWEEAGSWRWWWCATAVVIQSRTFCELSSWGSRSNSLSSLSWWFEADDDKDKEEENLALDMEWVLWLNWSKETRKTSLQTWRNCQREWVTWGCIMRHTRRTGSKCRTQKSPYSSTSIWPRFSHSHYIH